MSKFTFMLHAMVDSMPVNTGISVDLPQGQLMNNIGRVDEIIHTLLDHRACPLLSEQGMVNLMRFNDIAMGVAQAANSRLRELGDPFHPTIDACISDMDNLLSASFNQGLAKYGEDGLTNIYEALVEEYASTYQNGDGTTYHHFGDRFGRSNAFSAFYFHALWSDSIDWMVNDDKEALMLEEVNTMKDFIWQSLYVLGMPDSAVLAYCSQSPTHQRFYLNVRAVFLPFYEKLIADGVEMQSAEVFDY